MSISTPYTGIEETADTGTIFVHNYYSIFSNYVELEPSQSSRQLRGLDLSSTHQSGLGQHEHVATIPHVQRHE